VAIGSVFFVAYNCDLRLKFITKFCILLVADRLLVMILHNFHGNNYVSFDVFCVLMSFAFSLEEILLFSPLLF
jgi:hypothetical protein